MINGMKLRETRKKLGLSQEALAKKVGVSKVAICWYESGDRTPTLDNLFSLSEVLGLSLDELTGREINIVADDEKDYAIKLSKQDIVILQELKKYKDLYKRLYSDPARISELINRRMK